MKKRILSFLVVLVLLCSMMPMSVLAAEGESAVQMYSLYIEVQLDGKADPDGFKAYGSGSYAEGAKVPVAVSMPQAPSGYRYVFDGWYIYAGLNLWFEDPAEYLTLFTMPAEPMEIYAKFHMETVSGEITDSEEVLRPRPELDKESHNAYLNGYEDNTIRPNQNISRAEVAALLYRLLTKESGKQWYSDDADYSDVEKDVWYHDAVATLSNASVMNGYANGSFEPERAISRAEFATVLARFSQAAAVKDSGFTDVPSSHWAADSIALCKEQGWVTGYEDGSFCPDRPITRAEAVTMLNRMLERSCDSWGTVVRTWTDVSEDDWFYLDLMEAGNTHVAP